jgi:transcriptional regulator with XRE-family HTH domain
VVKLNFGFLFASISNHFGVQSTPKLKTHVIMLSFTSIFIVPEELSISLAQRVTQLRKDLGLTQLEVAKQLGVTQQAYGRYEAGQRKIPIDLMPALAKAFEVSVEDLMGISSKSKRRGPTSVLEKRFEEIQSLPKKEQRFIIETLDRLLKTAS